MVVVEVSVVRSVQANGIKATVKLPSDVDSGITWFVNVVEVKRERIQCGAMIARNRPSENSDISSMECRIDEARRKGMRYAKWDRELDDMIRLGEIMIDVINKWLETRFCFSIPTSCAEEPKYIVTILSSLECPSLLS